MDIFPCELTVLNMPQSVKAGETVNLEAHVEIYDPLITLGFVFLSLPETGELLRFAKKEDSTYIISYIVPYDAPAGEYSAAVYATSDAGLKTDPQLYKIRIL